jgi:hypothetical protein
MKVVLGESGRTEFKCLRCDEVDPLQTDAAKWAAGPLAFNEPSERTGSPKRFSH